MLNGGAVDWKARRVATKLSTTEAEYIALCLGGREASHGKQFLKELGFPPITPVVIFSDNNAAISIAKSDAVTQLNKHFDILHHWIRDSVKTKWYDIQRVETSGHLHQEPLGCPCQHLSYLCPWSLVLRTLTMLYVLSSATPSSGGWMVMQCIYYYD